MYLITVLLSLANRQPPTEPEPAGFDQMIDEMIRPITDAFAGVVFYTVPAFGQDWPLVVLWLIAGGVFFTFYLRFLPLRAGFLAVRVTRGRYSTPDDPGQITHFQALSAAVSGTVGIGNIAGVAIAITLGGPGAVFWLTLAGLLGMSTKMAECTLGVRYRRENRGIFSGGPMAYLSRGLEERGLGRFGRFAAVFYAIGIVIGCMGIGNMFQSNQAFVQFVNVTGGDSSYFADKGWLFGLVIAGLTGLVIIGGIRGIAAVASRMVPFMAILYITGAIVIILMNGSVLPEAMVLIVKSAFSAEAAFGGGVGAMVVGFQRAVFSNEAGIGSASIEHAAVKTRYPATEGLVSMIGPFLDTVIICNLTALVIVTTQLSVPGFFEGHESGIEMTSAAFQRLIPWSPYPLALAAILFAFSTLITWSYYGLKGWMHLVGDSKRAGNAFKLVYCLFAALGCMLQVDAVLDFSDALVFLICIPNLAGLYVLAPLVKVELARFLEYAGTEIPGGVKT